MASFAKAIRNYESSPNGNNLLFMSLMINTHEARSFLYETVKVDKPDISQTA